MPFVLANRHYRVADIVKDQNESRRYSAIGIGKIKPYKLTLRDEPFCRGVIIKIGQFFSFVIKLFILSGFLEILFLEIQKQKRRIKL